MVNDSYGDFFGATFENNNGYELHVLNESLANGNTAIYSGNGGESTDVDLSSYLLE